MGHGEENGALYYSYDKIHEIIGAKALEIKERFDPDMMMFAFFLFGLSSEPRLGEHPR